MEHLGWAVEDTIAGFWALGGETRTLNGARLIRNRLAPHVAYCNVVTGLVANGSGQVRALLDDAVEWIGTAAEIYVGPRTSSATEATLLLEGWSPSQTQVEMVATDVIPAPRRRPAEIRPARTSEDWACLEALFRMDHDEEARGAGTALRPIEYTTEAVTARRVKLPSVAYWIARCEGQPCGFFASWARPGATMAMVEDLFVHSEFRGRGVATQLLHHAVTQARSRGIRPVLIRADAADWPKSFYARLGFRPVAVTRYYAWPSRTR
ncbi:hypothetical protein GCM10022402_02120 [Salinactinospora qingdaonensis]|uniref:N-acetyltransferase domain-containing protein n=2 Tax=Salinactinospora qingdaonensis TaxID=702744 RepID=A0ABP7EW73_9ACTN